MSILHVSSWSARDVLRQVMKRTLHYDFSVWFWGDAIAMDGVLEASALLADPLPTTFCLRYYERWMRRPLSWVDHLTPGLALLRLFEITKKKEMLEAALLACQDASGFWRTFLEDHEAYLESSTAAFFGAAFLKGMRLGILDHTYVLAADHAWQAILSRLADDGSLYGVSACTYAAVVPGDDAALYRTLPTEVNVWGQGSALRFAAERIRAGLE